MEMEREHRYPSPVRQGIEQGVAMGAVCRFFVQSVTLGALILAATAMVVPLVWLFLSALKTRAELVAVPPVWMPKVPQWQNFSAAVREIPLFLYYRNSLTVAVTVSVLVVVTSAMAGFALAKYRFRAREILFRGILATMMLPSFIFVIPVYYMMRRVPLAGGNDWMGHGGVGLLHSHLALILPFAVSAWGIFLMRQFILGVPDSLLDAARIDGGSEAYIFWRLVLPLTRPALVTVGIFTFVSQWNSLFWPLVVATAAPELATLPVGLKMLNVAFDPNRYSHLILAGLTLGIVPVMALFASLQRYYVKGISMSGMKE